MRANTRFQRIYGNIIVGDVSNSDETVGKGLIYQDGVRTLVESPDPSLPILFFNGVHDGAIVGAARNAEWTAQKGAIYQNGVVTLIESPDPNFPFPFFWGVENGVIVGEADSADWSQVKGLIYQDGKVTLLNGPDRDFSSLILNDINNGVAVGYALKIPSGGIDQLGAISSIRIMPAQSGRGKSKTNLEIMRNINSSVSPSIRRRPSP
jgi:hypothetical protein